MCILSARLKLCTCDFKSVAKLRRSKIKHTWVLHRFDPTKSNMVIGRVSMPDTLEATIDADNRAMLLERLNEDDAFDVDLKPQEGDRLQLTFRCSTPNASGQLQVKCIHYGYSRVAGRWVEEPFCPLTWLWHHEEARFGVVQEALA